MVLTFQLNNEKDSIEILFDKMGLEILRDIINKNWHEPISKKDRLYDLDHEHLASIEWGGNELTPKFTSKDSFMIYSVKIVYLGIDGEKLTS
jgi:hypothetical protein